MFFILTSSRLRLFSSITMFYFAKSFAVNSLSFDPIKSGFLCSYAIRYSSRAKSCARLAFTEETLLALPWDFAR